MIRDAATIAIAPRALGAHVATARRSLIAAVGFTPKARTRGAGTGAGAITLAPVTYRANEDGHAAAGAEKTADGLAHRRSTTTDQASTTARSLCYGGNTLVIHDGWGHGIRREPASFDRCRARFFSGRFRPSSSGSIDPLSCSLPHIQRSLARVR
jgi:hypothetical protein